MAERESIIKQPILEGDRLGNNRMFARVTIVPHATLDFHEHHGETETYHVISGSAEYNDNGKIYTINPGDTVFCKDGDGHGVTNTTDEDFVFIALIIKS